MNFRIRAGVIRARLKNHPAAYEMACQLSDEELCRQEDENHASKIKRLVKSSEDARFTRLYRKIKN